jgi:hypothetical protein
MSSAAERSTLKMTANSRWLLTILLGWGNRIFPSLALLPAAAAGSIGPEKTSFRLLFFV